MRLFTTITRKARESRIIRWLLWVAGFYALLMIIYLYFMLGNLSTAPAYVYSQF